MVTTEALFAVGTVVKMTLHHTGGDIGVVENVEEVVSTPPSTQPFWLYTIRFPEPRGICKVAEQWLREY